MPSENNNALNGAFTTRAHIAKTCPKGYPICQGLN